MNLMPGSIEAADPPRHRKLAEGVAAAIARDVMAMGWPVGRSVGSMQDLLARYGVSHAVLREAVRQIEQNGLAVMRRGAGGGLVIARRPADVAAQTLATYLQLVDVDVHELIRAHYLIEDAIIRAAAERITAEQAASLRRLVAELDGGGSSEIELILRYNEFLGALAEIADNPLLTVMSKLGVRVMTPALAPADPEVIARTGAPDGAEVHKHRWVDLVESVIANDPARGVELLRGARPQVEARLIRRAEERRRQAQAGAATLIATEILEAVDEGRGRKHSQLVALSIARDIAAKGLPEGHHLGLEPALLAEYQVSRNIFREAARILEVHGVCSAKRGQRGGFIVGRPCPDYAVETAVTCLRYLGVQPQHVGAVRLAVQPSLAGLAAAPDATPEDLDALAADIDAGSEKGAARRFLERLGDLSGNRALALVNAVVLGLEEARPALASASEAGACKAADALEAIRAHDGAMARRVVSDLCRMDYPGL